MQEWPFSYNKLKNTIFCLQYSGMFGVMCFPAYTLLFEVSMSKQTGFIPRLLWQN